MNQFAELREQWINQFKAYSDDKLIESFNGKIGLKTFGVLLSIHLSVLEQEIISRSWDCSQIVKICPNTDRIIKFSYAFPVELRDNKLVQIKNIFWFNRKKIFLN
jgi:hypothetical protein